MKREFIAVAIKDIDNISTTNNKYKLKYYDDTRYSFTGDNKDMILIWTDAVYDYFREYKTVNYLPPWF